MVILHVFEVCQMDEKVGKMVIVFQSELKEASNYSMGSHHMSCTQGVIFHHFPPSCTIFMTILMIQDYNFTLSSNLNTPRHAPQPK